MNNKLVLLFPFLAGTYAWSCANINTDDKITAHYSLNYALCAFVASCTMLIFIRVMMSFK